LSQGAEAMHRRPRRREIRVERAGKNREHVYIDAAREESPRELQKLELRTSHAHPPDTVQHPHQGTMLRRGFRAMTNIAEVRRSSSGIAANSLASAARGAGAASVRNVRSTSNPAAISSSRCRDAGNRL